MKIYKLVFSPTGGTEKVADFLIEGLKGEAENIDLSQAGFAGCHIEKDSLAVIAMPSFGGRAPKTAIDRLKMIQGNGAKAVVVAVYGNRAQEDTLIEMSDVAGECGFEVIAGIEAVAEHSIAHQYAAGRPDAEDAGQLKEFAQKILDKMDKETEISENKPAIPGNRPYKKAGAGLVPKTDKNCTGCGLCVKKCPVGAINKENPKQIDKKICINCMRCVSVCPSKAKAGSSMMVKAVGVALKASCSDRKENKLYLL